MIERKPANFTATLTLENAEARGDFIAMRSTHDEPLDLAVVQALWCDVALGHTDATEKASPLAVKHVAGLLAMVHDLTEERDRLAAMIDAAHQQGFRP